MQLNRILAGTIASVLAFSSIAPAMADDRHDRREWREDRREHRQDRREWQRDRREWERDRREARRDDRRDWHRDHRYYAPPPRVVYRPAPSHRHGPPHRYGWQVGRPYRNYYSGPVYVVNDYGHRHLRRPPRGHQWIRDDRGDMLLVAIATGIIADIVLSGR